MNWRKVWSVARHDYVTHVKRAGFLIMTAAVPAMGALVLIIGAFFAGEAQKLGASFVQQFESADRITGIVDTSGYFSTILPEYSDRFILYDSQTDGETALQQEDIAQLLIIGADYIETGRVEAVTIGNSFGAATISDSSEIRAFLIDHLLSERVPANLRERAAAPLKVEPRAISSGGRTQGEGPWGLVFNFVVPYVLSIFLIMTIFTSSGYLLQSVAEEKENRVVEIIISSVRPTELMAGKVIGLGALGLTQVLIWLLSAAGFGSGAIILLAATAGSALPVHILILGVVYYLLGYTLYAILMAGIGALGTTMRESQQLAGIFSFFAAIPYMLSGFLFANPNATLPRILSFFPLTAPTMMMLRLPLAEAPWIDVAGSIAGMVIAIPIALWAGSKLFRFGLLIYGKRPTMREVWNILRRGT
ncbi:MAG: ABC transporter permease [Chloroflexi bacterium]|nr:ABC transporter permease [Chloroflexota bacterium]